MLSAPEESTRPLAGKAAWITGAGSGIGEAVARSLADAGAAVALSARSFEKVEAVVASIRQTGGTAAAHPLDVTRGDDTARIANEIADRFGSIDILVNNAGINVMDRHWERLTTASIEAIVGTNLTGTMYCVNAALPFMRAQKNGLIINTASIYGRTITLVPGPAYVATKHAVVALTETINMEECVNGIRACAFCPGEVVTPLLDARPVPVIEEDRRRMIQASDCGDVICFIASLPERLCVNELTLTPTWNRQYVAALRAQR